MDWQQILSRDKVWSGRIAQKGNGRFARPAAWILARTGDSLTWLVFIAILLWRGQPIGWELLAYIAVTAVIVAITKGIFRRKRPSGPGRAIATDKYAFPSGHAARVAVLSVVLSADFPSWTGLFLLWAVLVSLARVALARHYLTDVAAGFVLGVVVGLVGTAVF
jgi:undecaprenyl-diphosphatase